jgi:23S rRNA pseudouridine1911/1915/1917 synthase
MVNMTTVLSTPMTVKALQDEVKANGNTAEVRRDAVIPAPMAGQRVDRVVAVLFPEFSRSLLQDWIRVGRVRVDGCTMRPKDRVGGGERVRVDARIESRTPWQGQDLPLRVVYEDPHLLVIDKPAGVVVHPAAGNPDGTLVNALLHYAPELARVPRAGLVHRLDKDTTGLLVVARSLQAHSALVEQLKARAFVREYQAVAWGVVTAGGRIDAVIGRHPVDRKRMAVTAGGRSAATHYRIVRRFGHCTHLRVRLETGRTHQIRVHMAYIRHPLVGDRTYGGRAQLPRGSSPVLAEALQRFPRQALHAALLGIVHPVGGEALQWQSPLPADLAELLRLLEEHDPPA